MAQERIAKSGTLFTPEMIATGVRMVHEGRTIKDIVEAYKQINRVKAYQIEEYNTRENLAIFLRKKCKNDTFKCHSCQKKITVAQLSKSDFRFCKGCKRDLDKRIGTQKKHECYRKGIVRGVKI